ncbi:bis(5'-nucleosyl)-tetraphosphatase (symmetrical) YqeK [Salisediminibacterium halotolerans]|uniref:bis(5'-nucleosyl)-tetraphosphatase (symmetrical) n=1 Tax=Salisediminibacterium halotolerans TaxID=517425 RepID=A0A1H9S4I4_9BACI|nr:bis(5'-nucleosyl)-tetraphosphatase (symmetrical) YqeK [Salisediminibacterium haloalkalitolerans]SER79838.1 putative HD superfamily hydrolase of NAD metabolism [Salisediminibacterium haloalkalitolerans]
MDEQQAWMFIAEALKPKRFEHTKRVVEEAERLQEKFGGDLKRIKYAAIVHDYAKYRDINQMRETVRESAVLPKNLLLYGDELLHAFVGAEYLRSEQGITDELILDAVRYHTTGRKGMTTEEKIVFLADYIEPGRTFKEAAEAREAAAEDLDKGCFKALKNTIIFLASEGESIYPDTFEAYNEIQQNLQR